jgi:succinoglycan biosynthesis protein ExoM
MLRRLLLAIAGQDSHGAFTFSGVVADNDAEASARPVVEQCATPAFPIVYCMEPRRNIALVRNQCLAHAQGDAVVFIDDDEFPQADWLYNLFATWSRAGVAGVLGPVRPDFPAGTPDWVRRGGFYNRPEHPTGFVLDWAGCRTGNVLLNRSIFAGVDSVFDPQFATAGEDMDFFRRMIGAGHRFIWCNEAVAYETVPPSRWKRAFLLRRALHRGSHSFQHPTGRAKNVIKALFAVPLYALALPFLLLAGQHFFMRYLVRLCDHAGRLLGCVGLYQVREREM